MIKCKKCGETEKDKFYEGKRTICIECKLNMLKKSRVDTDHDYIRPTDSEYSVWDGYSQEYVGLNGVESVSTIELDSQDGYYIWRGHRLNMEVLKEVYTVERMYNILYLMDFGVMTTSGQLYRACQYYFEDLWWLLSDISEYDKLHKVDRRFHIGYTLHQVLPHTEQNNSNILKSYNYDLIDKTTNLNKKWEKLCPNCNTSLWYKDKAQRNQSKRNGVTCYECK